MSGHVRGNLLSLEQQSNETGASSWVNNLNATVSLSAVSCYDGMQALGVTSVLGSAVKVVTPQIAISPNAVYNCSYWTLAAVNGRTSQFSIDLYTSGSLITTVTSPTVTSNTSTWTQNTLLLDVARSSPGITHLAVGLALPSPGALELQFFDRMLILPANSVWSAWSRILAA